ncbi:MAG: hypothetical protein H6623_08055 [Bdellovibrionaceae bacterium]|nr:hypothetical protein [Pseudobdellovibrionaceae bacterium]
MKTVMFCVLVLGFGVVHADEIACTLSNGKESTKAVATLPTDGDYILSEGVVDEDLSFNMQVSCEEEQDSCEVVFSVDSKKAGDELVSDGISVSKKQDSGIYRIDTDAGGEYGFSCKYIEK